MAPQIVRFLLEGGPVFAACRAKEQAMILLGEKESVSPIDRAALKPFRVFPPLESLDEARRGQDSWA